MKSSSRFRIIGTRSTSIPERMLPHTHTPPPSHRSSSAPDKLTRTKESDETEAKAGKIRVVPRQLEQRPVDSLGIAMADSGTPLQGGSGWSISGALYVTNLRIRRSLMPVRGPWRADVWYAWVIKYEGVGDGQGEEERARKGGSPRGGGSRTSLFGFLNGFDRPTDRPTPPSRLAPRLPLRRRLRLHDVTEQ